DSSAGDDDDSSAGDDDDSSAGDDDDSSAGDDDDSAEPPPATFTCGVADQCLTNVEYCELFVGGAPPPPGSPPTPPSSSCSAIPTSCLPPNGSPSCVCVLVALGLNGMASTCDDTVPGELEITLYGA
ncbi:MAG: hypothetical protein CMP23_16435, partial [Rickettsiales bacterium]|nr:hypothetical protein [Rickettsiales bacterium]